MIISGIQKLTLLDFPGRVACTVFTLGCNFRCPFCHNALLVTDTESAQKYSEEEILDFLKKRVGTLDGICITGGEPLMYDDIDLFLKKVRELGYKIKVDTNGSFPDNLKKLIDNKLVDYVAMDIKNSREKYPQTVGLKYFDTAFVEKSVNILKESGIDFEFRTTVSKEYHTVSDIEKIGEWIKGAKKYFLQQYVASDDLLGEELTPLNAEEMGEFCMAIRKYVPSAQVRGI